uniref:Dehydrogenase/reductase (SDR family) member 9 n=1 Tax=Xiphophorus maculatus TaxID=8083 RepID=A0A3B5QIT4_XIPMA
MFLYILGLVTVWYLYRWYKESKRVPNKGSKYVYITGCDSGFGNNLAKHLDKLGFCVIAGCYTEKGETELKKVSSERLTAISLDVAKSESVKKVAAFIKTLVGEKGLWAVVNNAGVATPSGPVDWLTIDDYKSMLAVNLNGVIDVTLSVLPLIKKARGRVVNVASVFGRIKGPDLNMAPFGVKVLCIEPGFFKTSVTDTVMLKNQFKGLWDRLPQDMKDDYGQTFLETSEFNQLRDSDLMKVVHCMEHAIASIYPRYRYSPGWDAKFLWLPISYMPTWISDRFFLRYSPKPKVSMI